MNQPTGNGYRFAVCVSFFGILDFCGTVILYRNASKKFSTVKKIMKHSIFL